MATPVNISMKWIQSLASPAKGRVYYRDEFQRTLHLCVSSTGTKTWQRYGRVNGKMTRVRIGTYPDISVKAAREICQTINADIALGKDVRAGRRATSQTRTMGTLWEWYLEYHAKPTKKTWRRDLSTWNRVLSKLKAVPIEHVTRSQLVEIVAAAAKAGGPGAGNKAIELARMLFNVAIRNEWATRNPAASLEKNVQPSRERFLSQEEVPKFFDALARSSDRIRDFFLLALYTGARRSNIMAMEWSEIDFTLGMWCIPRDKSKTKAAMILPLAGQAIEILRRRRDARTSDKWVFPSQSKTGHYVEPKDAWDRIKQRCGITDLRIHDLRRTLGSWQANANVSLPIIGKSLGHASSLSETSIYARVALDPVRQAVQNAVDAMEFATKQADEQKSKKT